MLAGQAPKLVNKQFNSPINLYSPQNVQETLDRQTKILANGAVGIDFNQLAKPANLQNSAVLRMLEEEEARQRGKHAETTQNYLISRDDVRDIIRPKGKIREYWSPLCPKDGRFCRLEIIPERGLRRVTWPPPSEDQVDFAEQSPIQAKTRGLGEYASYQSSPSSGPSPQPPTSNLPRVSPQSPLPASPGGTLRQPSSFQPSTPKAWAAVTPPATSPLPQPTWGHPQPPQQPSFQGSNNQQAPKQIHHKPRPVFEPPPTFITLRSEPPISQEPPLVYQAQPAATMAPVSGSMRGDKKWPPESVRQQTEAENQARLQLAKGPLFRPRRVAKDYSGFFAQHALSSNYPGYRAPPGTQAADHTEWEGYHQGHGDF